MASPFSQNTRIPSRTDMKEEDEEWQQVNLVSTLIPASQEVKGKVLEQASTKGAAGRSPSRGELLSIVRKHSESIGQQLTNHHEFETFEELDMQFWQEMLDMFFVRGLNDLKSLEADDLVFFVRLMGIQCGNEQYDESNESSMAPFFVRRWAPELEKVIGSNAWEVDWRRSFYLNFIEHTSFSLTIAICSLKSLQNHKKPSGAPLTPIYKVTKTVYASPSRTNLQADAKASETVAAYPDICFAVDDYDDTFEGVVLTDEDHCYCVLLNAHGGAAFPPESEGGQENGRTSHEARMLGEATQESSSSKVTLFSGFVSYDTIRLAFEGGNKRNLRALLQIGGHHKAEKFIMRGPGGRGDVEVSVTAVPSLGDAKQHAIFSQPSPTKAGAKLGLGSVMKKAAMVASTVAKNALAVAEGSGKGDEELIPLRCCLMSLSLPWNTLAADLLFKELPKPASR